MRIKYFSLLLILFLFTTNIKSQNLIYMPYIEVVNIHPDYEYSLSKLMQENVSEENKYKIIIPEKSDTGYTIESFIQAKETAQSLYAKYFLIGLVNVVSQKATVQFTMYNSYDGSKVWSDMVKNQKAENLELIIIKFAQHIGDEEEIFFDDGRSKLHRFAYNTFIENATLTFGGKIGAAYIIINKDKVPNRTAPGFGINIAYDIKSFIIDFNYDIYMSNTQLANYNLGIIRPLFKAERTPYIGFNYGSTSITAHISTVSGKETNGGSIFKINGGYIFSRTKDLNFRINAEYYLTNFKVYGKNPNGFMLNLSLFLFL